MEDPVNDNEDVMLKELIEANLEITGGQVRENFVEQFKRETIDPARRGFPRWFFVKGGVLSRGELQPAQRVSHPVLNSLM